MTQKTLDARELAAAVERALVRLYDQELRQYNEARRFKWLAVALSASTAILAVFDVDWFKATLVLSIWAGLAWLIGHTAWRALNDSIGELTRSLGASDIFVGGEGRDVRLTTNPYETPFGIKVGKWLSPRSSSPQSEPTD